MVKIVLGNKHLGHLLVQKVLLTSCKAPTHVYELLMLQGQPEACALSAVFAQKPAFKRSLVAVALQKLALECNQPSNSISTIVGSLAGKRCLLLPFLIIKKPCLSLKNAWRPHQAAEVLIFLRSCYTK